MSEILPGDDGDAEQNNYRMLCRTWERNREEGVSQMLLGSRFSQVEEEERNEFSFLAIGLRFECARPPPPSENE